MEFNKNAGATTLYLFLGLVKWIGYLAAGIIALVGVWIEQSMSTSNPSSTLGFWGMLYFGFFAVLAYAIGWGAGFWRDTIIVQE